MTYRNCAICELPFGRRGGKVVWKRRGRHVTICRVCDAERRLVTVVVDPEGDE